ncbi:MAG: M1 family aminopeptidase [bacterium]
MPKPCHHGQNIEVTSGRPGIAMLLVLVIWLLTLAGSVPAASPPVQEPPLDPAAWEKQPLLPEAAPKLFAKAPPIENRGYDVTHYDLDVVLDIPDKSITGQIGISLACLATELDLVQLDLVHDLTVDSLTWATGSDPAVPAMFEHVGDSVFVSLPATLNLAESGQLTIWYHGRPPRHGPLNSGLLFREYGHETPELEDDHPIIAALNQPWSAHSWWPCKDHPHDKATARVAVTAPDTLTIVANGLLQSETTPAPGLKRSEWLESYPIATYLIAFVVSNYVSWEETCMGLDGPVSLTYHIFPPDLAKAEYDLAATCDMLHFLEDRFGPYPFSDEKYGQAEIHWVGAMENQTLSCHSRFLFTGDRRYEKIICHEFVHHWFGNMITPALWADIWLSEGFARYCEALWLEHTEGLESYLAYMHKLGPVRHDDLFVGDGILTDPDPILPNLLIYDKGAWILHLLRGYLENDTVFFDFLHDYATNPTLAHANVTTADFLSILASSTGQDLSVMLDPWLNSDTAPILFWQVEKLPTGQAGTVEVRLHLEQKQDPLFDLKLPIHLVSADGVQVETLHVTEREHQFSWTLTRPIQKIALDPEGWVLWRRDNEPFHPVLLLPATPNPSPADGTTIHFSLPEAGRVHCSVYDVRGRRLGRWDLGFRPASIDRPDSWFWNGRDGQQRPLPAGVYWLELKTERDRAVQKLTLVR